MMSEPVSATPASAHDRLVDWLGLARPGINVMPALCQLAPPTGSLSPQLRVRGSSFCSNHCLIQVGMASIKSTCVNSALAAFSCWFKVLNVPLRFTGRGHGGSAESCSLIVPSAGAVSLPNLLAIAWKIAFRLLLMTCTASLLVLAEKSFALRCRKVSLAGPAFSKGQ